MDYPGWRLRPDNARLGLHDSRSARHDDYRRVLLRRHENVRPGHDLMVPDDADAFVPDVG